MALLFGIDTGGTYTDAVLFDEEKGVLSSAKALTTKDDLSVGIRNAFEAVIGDSKPDIRMVSISTTLATNAIVEGYGSPNCLILIGYPEDALGQAGLREALGKDPVVFISGGHTVTGEEKEPLDIEAAKKEIVRIAPSVAAFAVSGYFGVRNPEHETSVRDLVSELTGLPVTCGHELTSNLHAARRALTTAFNARLIPLLQELIHAVQRMLGEKGYRVPLMVVKGDGSLVKAEFALKRPVETILFGPAASVVGATFLSKEKDTFVSDMGGTTTDISLLKDGKPVLNTEGAVVGGFRTMVEAVSIHTFGLGGDSEVRFALDRRMVLGPKRVIPLSLLAVQHPEIIGELDLQSRGQVRKSDGIFIQLIRRNRKTREELSVFGDELFDKLEKGPVSLSSLYAAFESDYMLDRDLLKLSSSGVVSFCGLTPSDASHVAGSYHAWSSEAAKLGAEIWHRKALSSLEDPAGDPVSFCERIIEQAKIQSGKCLVSAALSEEYGIQIEEHEELSRLFIDESLGKASNPYFGVSLSLKKPVIAIGAPAHAYYPGVAEKLRTRLVVPEHAGIANAIGAVAGGIMQTVRGFVRPIDGEEEYRAFFPNGVQTFVDVKDAVSWLEKEVVREAENLAVQAGASRIEVHVESREVTAGSGDNPILIEVQMTATAVGRPQLAGL